MEQQEHRVSAAYEQAARAERGPRVWMFLFFLVAASLWGQWLGPAAMAELRSEDGSETVLALQLLPLAVGLAAAMWRHPIGRLVVFPVSFLPGLALLPGAEWEALASPWSLMLALATFGLYLIVSAARPPEATYETPRPTKSLEDEPIGGDGLTRSYRRFLIGRVVALTFIFGVITYALFGSTTVTEALNSVPGEQARKIQHSFTAVVMYFTWMIAAYVGIILPSLNWEYDRRRSILPERQRRLLNEPRRLQRRIWIWLAILMAVTTSTVYFLAT